MTGGIHEVRNGIEVISRWAVIQIPRRSWSFVGVLTPSPLFLRGEGEPHVRDVGMEV